MIFGIEWKTLGFSDDIDKVKFYIDNLSHTSVETGLISNVTKTTGLIRSEGILHVFVTSNPRSV